MSKGKVIALTVWVAVEDLELQMKPELGKEPSRLCIQISILRADVAKKFVFNETEDGIQREISATKKQFLDTLSYVTQDEQRREDMDLDVCEGSCRDTG